MSRSAALLDSPVEILHLARRYPLRWLLPAVAIAGIGCAVAALRHDSWEASQALMVRDEAGAAGPLDRPGKFQHAEEMKSAQETILELAKNRTVLAEALQQVGPPPGADLATWPAPRVVAQLESNLKLAPPKGADFGKTEIFYLKVQDRDRQRACLLVEAIGSSVQRHFQDLRGLRAQSMIDELTRTVALARADLQQSTDKLSAIEKSVGSDLAELRILQEAPAGDSQMRRTNIEIENELRQVRTSQQSNRELLSLLKRAQDNPRELLDAPSRLLDSQPAIKRLKDGLVDAQLRTAQLMGLMSEDHPQVQVAKEAQQRVSEGVNNELAAAIRGIQLELKLSQQRGDFLEKQLDSNSARLTHVAEVRAEYGNLVAETRHRNEIVKAAEQELSEARGSQAAAHSANLITTVDKAETGLDPVGPSKAIIAAGSIAGGLLIGVGLLLISTQPAAYETTVLALPPSEVIPPAAQPAIGNHGQAAVANLTVKQALQKVSGSRSVWN